MPVGGHAILVFIRFIISMKGGVFGYESCREFDS